MSPPTRIAEIGREAVDIEFATEPLIEPAIDNLLEKLHDSLFCAVNAKSLVLRKLKSGRLEKNSSRLCGPSPDEDVSESLGQTEKESLHFLKLSACRELHDTAPNALIHPPGGWVKPIPHQNGQRFPQRSSTLSCAARDCGFPRQNPKLRWDNCTLVQLLSGIWTDRVVGFNDHLSCSGYNHYIL